MVKDVDLYDLIPKLVGVILLVAILLLVLMWTGVVRCGSFPYLCDFYYTVVGSPRVAIIYGGEGLGDPMKLQMMLLNPEIVGVENVATYQIDQVALANLKNYKLVIVENAKKMSREQLEMFMQYTNQNGGRLVWIGDAGTEPIDEEKEVYNDLKGIIDSDPEDMNLPAKTKSELLDALKDPWSRVLEKDNSYDITDFGQFLGVEYIGNYCSLLGAGKCSGNLKTVGSIQPEKTGNNPLIYGMSPSVTLRVKEGRDFSVVRIIPNSNTGIVASLNFPTNLLTGDKVDVGKNVPFIVTSGFGERVAYYAYPPEYLVEDNNAYLIMKQMVRGMLGE
ncbi:MAG: hypothetical protein WC308_01080 [archaeon]|jgi:hypothetical protein